MGVENRLPVRVLICGDSISAGVVYDEQAGRYMKSKESFVCRLQNSLNCVITNISRFGNTILTALPKLSRDLSKETPDVVLIELGGNDCDFKWDEIARNPEADYQPATDLRVFQSKLLQTALSLKEKGIEPVLMTLPPLDPDRYLRWVSKNSAELAEKILVWLGSVSRIYWWHERYNAAVLKVAQTLGVRLIDLRSAFLSTPDFRKYLCMDGIHPNRDGHRLISDAIADYLRENYPLLLKPSIA